MAKLRYKLVLSTHTQYIQRAEIGEWIRSGWVFCVFGAPRFSVQRSQTTYFSVPRASGLKIGAPRNLGGNRALVMGF